MLIPRHPLLTIYTKPTDDILSLLTSVVLGTNGAHYRQLDTRERIMVADDPIFLCLERNNRVLGNVTFCQRGGHWYVRYFAFDSLFPTAGSKASSSKKSILKDALNNYFDEVLNDTKLSVDAFYAYIDPRNSRSALLSQTMGFDKIGSVITQTFSRRNPKNSGRVSRSSDWSKIAIEHEERFHEHKFYFDAQTSKPPFYLLENEKGEMLAAAKIHIANWEIKRLPGRFGGTLVKLLPWIPIIRSLIKPKKHSFVVPEGVMIKNNDPKLLAELFEGILASEKKKVAIWWVDPREDVYVKSVNSLKWGLLDKIIGRNVVDVVTRSRRPMMEKKLFYVSGFDFI